ncbi:BRO family protein [Microvirga sp. W0021]|uniref:BRO family protein n=1 Tax=Hohaiivirga grylli TaxID=3133970 RepID=A0ABV0BI76_9HYPH
MNINTLSTTDTTLPVPTLFQSEQFGNIRVVERNGMAWFVAKDIAERLGYSNPHKAISDHCKNTSQVGGNGIQSLDPRTILIGQSDVMRLVTRSSLPTAGQFKGWIFKEVLPSVLKNNMLVMPQTIEAILANPDTTIRILTELKSERESRLDAELTKAEIGSRREATAMATASAAVRRANQLCDELGQGAKQATITAIENITGVKYDWVPMRRWCRTNNIAVNNVLDPRWGTVKAWPAQAWKEVHDVDLSMIFPPPAGEA